MTMYIVTDFSLQGTTTTLGHENDFEVDKWRKFSSIDWAYEYKSGLSSKYIFLELICN